MSTKLLIISDAWHPQVNGVVKTYEHLRIELEKHDVITEVISPANFAVTMPLPFYPEIKLAIRPYKRLKRRIRDFQPDKIHIATEGPLGWSARKYCLRKNLPFTTCYHTQFPDYIAKRFAWLIPPLYNQVYRLAIKAARTFHTPSSACMVATKSLETQLLEWGFTCPIKPLTRGVNFSVFHPGEKTILHDLPTPIALYVGRIAIEKNLEEFLEMPWDGSKVIVGNGPIRQQLEKKYKNTHFVGKKTNKELADFYRAADIFVFPSKTDTFGIVLIEALACGLPVAAHDVMGPKDIIKHPSLGALNEKLEIAASEALQSGKPEACNQHVKENYSWQQATQNFIDAL